MEETIQKPAKTGNMNGGRAWAVVLVVFLAGFCMPANMGETMWIAPVVMESLGFGPDILGWVNGVFYILGAVIAFPAASFIRRLGIRWSVTIALACGILGNAIGIFAADVTVLMVSRIIQGAGFGLMGVIGVAAISPWFPKEKRGLPLGVWAIWVAAANAITPMLDAAIVQATGNYVSVWQFFLVFDIVVLVLFLLVYARPPTPISTRLKSAVRSSSRIRSCSAIRSYGCWRSCSSSKKVHSLQVKVFYRHISPHMSIPISWWERPS